MKSRRWKINRLLQKRNKKALKRKRLGKEYIDLNKSPYSREILTKINSDRIRLLTFDFELNNYLNNKGNVFTGTLSFDIEMPVIFCLEKNYNEVLVKFSEIRTALISMEFELIRLNFTRTKEVSFEVLFLLKVIVEEYLSFLKKSQNRLEVLKIIPDLKVRRSRNNEVNLKLYSNELIKKERKSKDENSDEDLIHKFTTGFFKGSKLRRSYEENKKGLAGSEIRKLIDRGLETHGYQLNKDGVNNLDGIVSEILNNAEDHSPFATWYTFGNLFETNNRTDNSENVGQINLAFLNFGHSIYEGFLETKEENFEMFDSMNLMSENIINKSKKSFSKESLFTLYALQDGYSRLKNIEQSRGTGTMKFINSFLYLGDYEDPVRGYYPKLLIYSGRTTLKCDNKYRPFQESEGYYISLNNSNSLLDAPEATHLIENQLNFPGTFLVVKIFLNKNHLNKKLESREQNN